MVELDMGEGEGRRRFAISATEATVAQLEACSPPWLTRLYEPESKDCPAFMVTWSEAANYCNWLSQQEGIPEEEWCYFEVATDNGHPLLLEKPDATNKRGYRLPTVAEWELACRAGTTTERFFGDGVGLLAEYAWQGPNTHDGRVRPVGTKRPNQFGLFDMYGNAIEWCHDEPPDNPDYRLLRGLGAGDYEPDRSQPIWPGDASLHGNAIVAGGIGFRVARTLRTDGGEIENRDGSIAATGKASKP
jgi:formylglycine-generating enzyme required for sulfatase activity